MKIDVDHRAQFLALHVVGNHADVKPDVDLITALPALHRVQLADGVQRGRRPAPLAAGRGGDGVGHRRAGQPPVGRGRRAVPGRHRAAAHHVTIAELAAVARVAANLLHRLVAQPLDQADDVVQPRIVVAVLRRGAQLGPEPLMVLEVRGAGRDDFFERGLLLVVHDLADRRQAVHGVGKGGAAAGEDVVLGALRQVAGLVDAAVEEARGERRLAPLHLSPQHLHLPLVRLLDPRPQVPADGGGELGERLQLARRRRDVLPPPLALVAAPVGQRRLDGVQVTRVRARVVIELAGDAQLVAAHRHVVVGVLARDPQFHQPRRHHLVVP